MEKEIIKYALPRLAFNINICNMDPSGRFRGFHRHKETEIIKISDGEIKCFFGEETVILKKGELLLINSNTVHKLAPVGKTLITYIQVDVSKYKNHSGDEKIGYIEEYLTGINSDSYAVFSGKNEMIKIFENIETEIRERKIGFENYIRGYMYNIVAFMYRHGLLSEITSFSNEISEIMPIIKYIDENYKNKLYLDELAQIIHSNRFRLCRSFKNLTGSTVFDYINFVRLRNAEEMLLENTLSATQIAFECGFTSIQYFNKVFKSNMGCSPSAFKKRSKTEF